MMIKESTVIAKNSTFIKILVGDRFRVARHLFCLCVLLIFIGNSKPSPEFSGHYDLYEALLTYFVIVGIFYFNMYVLIPKVFFKRRHLRYFLFLTVTLIIGILIGKAFTLLISEPHRIVPKSNPKKFFDDIVGIVIILIAFILPSTALKLFQRWVLDSDTINELKLRALESELKALRNQINPHFLFNMLNNINVLTKTEPQKASDIIVKLSGFLRYLLYENDSGSVCLQHEMRFIEDFLELEAIRRDDFEHTVKYDLSQISGINIPSNILLPIVENAAKHSADPEKYSFVSITVSIQNRILVITCENSIPKQPGLPVKDSGIGLTNLRRRLELLYGNSCDLHLNKVEMLYNVTLSIPV
ncbi:histidine kinase [Mucilaginibacter hurinus]|uniref:Histidine kinase n=1 Tax=Mucilaginibacter hurinus TaxID=2201324 RepID=A0A367GNY9_9SPHI|nr:histidine kinase [Mucilaginibacter hurinus]RCH54755.1 histidine kinase [Mucilaginibacter hurinus]